MMKIVTMMMLAALFNLGAAHAETVKPTLGFDRVGMVSSEKQRFVGERSHTADSVHFKAAPGEGADAASNYPARKREMARRLVWLMLSAR
jgi:hypothetical protein